ncbi:hypothetical protein GGTG_03934 [Gaeumannomyces tritici R3-111a-1]|uniref:Uncharacterized protein n=1 Tax=Gaeumannomyces tritici (strain R3-111a-1) TaxID=644352 RepID=J3NRN3_GAET3|nr:hypothetical protein GGTG_03934 [Gaeumannomyces tritici R3-111a-1]EJT78839.1 hypothetical protein GGTG_03934 [Gaeumannomyces tritici R3-111a-1]
MVHRVCGLGPAGGWGLPPEGGGQRFGWACGHAGWDGSEAASRLVTGVAVCGLRGEGDNSWETGKSKVVGDGRRTGNSGRKAASTACAQMLPASEGTRDQTRKEQFDQGSLLNATCDQQAPPAQPAAGQWGPALTALGWLRRRALRGGVTGGWWQGWHRPQRAAGLGCWLPLLACARYRLPRSLNSHGRVGETSGMPSTYML